MLATAMALSMGHIPEQKIFRGKRAYTDDMFPPLDMYGAVEEQPHGNGIGGGASKGACTCSGCCTDSGA